MGLYMTSKILEARSLKLRCRPGHAPSGGSREESIFCLFQLLVAAGIPALCLHHCGLYLGGHITT